MNDFSLKLDVPLKNLWAASDYHLGHDNVLKFDNRPFSSVELMEETIKYTHSFLTKDDHLFIIGDLFWKKDMKDIESFLAGIPSKVYFISGNHDKLINNSNKTKSFFEKTYGPYFELYVRDLLVVMCHYPLLEWNKGHFGSWHLFGHTHGNDVRNLSLGQYRTKNVGIMLNDEYPYTPFNFQDIEEEFKNRKDIPHG